MEQPKQINNTSERLLIFQIFMLKSIKYLEFTKKQRIFVIRFKNN